MSTQNLQVRSNTNNPVARISRRETPTPADPNRLLTRKITFLSVADTAHDFRKKFDKPDDNIFYNEFMQEQKRLHNDLNEDFYDYKSESSVMQYLKIDDGVYNKNTAPFYSQLTIDDFEKQKMDIKSFVVNVKSDDLISADFQSIFLGPIIENATNNKNMEVISDFALLTKDILCSIKSSHNKNVNLIICQATQYDRGAPVIGDCVITSDIDAILRKEEGNLFGLDFIGVQRVKAGDDVLNYAYAHGGPVKIGDEILKYQYTVNNTKKLIILKLSYFITAQTKFKTRFLTFLSDMIIEMNQVYAGKKSTMKRGDKPDKKQETSNKRSHNDDALDINEYDKKQKQSSSKTQTIPLDVFFEQLLTVYGLNYEDFTFYNKTTKTIDRAKAKQFAYIIFDLKRAGDQMQVKSATHNKQYVFISNDAIAIAYAYCMGVPCIKTSKYGKGDEEAHATRKLTFYNFLDQNIKNIIEKKEYYVNLIQKKLNQYSSYALSLKQIKERAQIQILPSEQQITQTDIKIIKDMVLRVIAKSLHILTWENNKLKLSTRTTRSEAKQSVNPVEGKELYIYTYVHRFNVILHIIVYNILLEVEKYAAIEAQVQALKTEFSSQVLTKQNQANYIDELKTFNNKMANNPSFTLMKVLNLALPFNEHYITEIIKLYKPENKSTDQILFNMEAYEYNVIQSNQLSIDYIKQLMTYHLTNNGSLEQLDEFLELIENIGPNKIYLKSFLFENFFKELPSTNTKIINRHLMTILEKFIMTGKNINIPVLDEFIAFIDYAIKSPGRDPPNRYFTFDETDKSEVMQFISDKDDDGSFFTQTKVYLQDDKGFLHSRPVKKNIDDILPKYEQVILDLFKNVNLTSYLNVFGLKQSIQMIFEKKVLSIDRMQFGGSPKQLLQLISNDHELSHFDIFREALDNVYTYDKPDDNVILYNDLSKIIITFFAHQYHIFNNDGNITQEYIELLQTQKNLKKTVTFLNDSSLSNQKDVMTQFSPFPTMKPKQNIHKYKTSTSLSTSKLTQNKPKSKSRKTEEIKHRVKTVKQTKTSTKSNQDLKSRSKSRRETQITRHIAITNNPENKLAYEVTEKKIVHKKKNDKTVKTKLENI